MKHKLDDLIVLRFCIDKSYVEVQELSEVCDNRLDCDADNGEWTYEEYSKGIVLKKIHAIGRPRTNGWRDIPKEGVIGVYDRYNTYHLTNMVTDSSRALSDKDSK